MITRFSVIVLFKTSRCFVFEIIFLSTEIRIMSIFRYFDFIFAAGVLNDFSSSELYSILFAFIRVYKSSVGLIVSLLPTNEYPNGEIYFTKKVQSDAKMVHNNYLQSTAEKVERFKEFGFWNESDSAFLKVNRYAI